MRPFLLLTLFLLISFLLIGCSAKNSTHDDRLESHRIESDDADLASYMATLQRYAQKLGFAVQHQNSELARFYHHELEELSEEIIDTVLVYDEQPISVLTQAMLMPALKRLEQTLEETPHAWNSIRDEYNNVIASCNNCHSASNHGFIKITPSLKQVSPYNQDFSAQ